jgi:hypothetical protein
VGAKPRKCGEFFARFDIAASLSEPSQRATGYESGVHETW